MFDKENQETPGNVTKEVVSANTTSVGSPTAFDTILAGIKNPNGEQKYNSVNDALYALRQSQEYIPTLTTKLTEKDQEIADLRKKLEGVETLRETVEQLTRNQEQKKTSTNSLDEEQIANIVGNQITALERSRSAQANQREVVQTLADKFGDKAKDVFYEKANSLGLSPEDLESLSARSPQAVKALFNIETSTQKSSTKSPMQSTTTSVATGNPSSLIGRETHKLPLGASSHDYAILQDRAKQMVTELEQAGMSIHDMTDPKTYFKYFSK